MVTPPACSRAGSLTEHDSPAMSTASPNGMCAALRHDQSVGQRRSSTALRPSSMERPQMVGHHRARLHLVQHAACGISMLALLSIKPTRPVSGVSQHSWRRRGSTPRWVPFGERASRHVRRCAAATTALTRRPNGPLLGRLPPTHSTVYALAEPPSGSRPPPTASARRPTSSASPPPRMPPPPTSPPIAEASH